MSKIIRIDSLHHGDRKNCTTNGSGIRLVVWFLGCDIRCSGCHNKEYWDFDNPYFEDFSEKHLTLITEEMNNNQNVYSGLSILGGEPFSVKNIDDVIILCKNFKQNFRNKDIWIWSGYTLEWLQNRSGEYGDKIKKLFDLCDFLVDGEFQKNKRNIALKFRGSPNQIIWEKKDNIWVQSDLNN